MFLRQRKCENQELLQQKNFYEFYETRPHEFKFYKFKEIEENFTIWYVQICLLFQFLVNYM